MSPAGSQVYALPVATTADVQPGELTAGRRIAGIDPLVDPRWTAFVESHPDGTIYQHPAWLRVLAQAFGLRIVGFGCEEDEGRLVGVLPLAWVARPLSRPRLSSLPHTPEAGPLAVDDDAARALLRAAVGRVGATPGARLLVKLASDRAVDRVGGMDVLPWSESYDVELPEDPSAVRFGGAKAHGNIRRQVAKAGEFGLTLRRAAHADDLRAWYAMYLDTIRAHAAPPMPYRFFRAMWVELRPSGLMHLTLVERQHDGRAELLAGSVFLTCARTIVYSFSARTAAGLAVHANELMQWHTIHDAVRDGFRRYDMGEVPADNPGLAAFKRKWGAEPRWIYHATYPGEGGAAGAFSLRPGSGARQLVGKLWRRLPLPATVLLGDLVHSYVKSAR